MAGGCTAVVFGLIRDEGMYVATFTKSSALGSHPYGK